MASPRRSNDVSSRPGGQQASAEKAITVQGSTRRASRESIPPNRSVDHSQTGSQYRNGPISSAKHRERDRRERNLSTFRSSAHHRHHHQRSYHHPRASRSPSLSRDQIRRENQRSASAERSRARNDRLGKSSRYQKRRSDSPAGVEGRARQNYTEKNLEQESRSRGRARSPEASHRQHSRQGNYRGTDDPAGRVPDYRGVRQASNYGSARSPDSRYRRRDPSSRRSRDRATSARPRSADRRRADRQGILRDKRKHPRSPRSRSRSSDWRSLRLDRSPSPRLRYSTKDRQDRILTQYRGHRQRHSRSRSRSRDFRRNSRGSPASSKEMHRPYGHGHDPRFARGYDASDIASNYYMHGVRAHDPHSGYRGSYPPHAHQHHTSPPHWTPTSSYSGSPHPVASPYYHDRSGWRPASSEAHRPPSIHAQSPQPYHSSLTYTAQASPFNSHHHPTAASPSYHGRGAPPQTSQSLSVGQFPQSQSDYQSFAGNGPEQHDEYDNRTRHAQHPPGPPLPMPTRGKTGHFQNLQWTASNNRSRKETTSQNPASSSQNAQGEVGEEEEEEANPFRPSKALQVEDQSEKVKSEDKTSKSTAKDTSKFSFAFKSKNSTSNTANKHAPPDLSRRTTDPADHRTLDKSAPPHRTRQRSGERARHEPRPSIEAPSSPVPRTEKRTMKRTKPRRILSPSLADSSSVYYRKPGNESVVGSGTYGKVFKAIHVYTKQLAALKKIRMEGEKDGFPVTAVREIKLLQSLHHENIVSLQEVMVEHNDCFMVFEYLSHDLTGLLNHPTFTLEQAHRKDLSKQLFLGLSYLHRRGVLHRDIKAANILVSNEGQLKLADFGLARFYCKRGSFDYTNRVITIWYRSPELLLGETRYGPAVDIWSAACVMVEIFTRHAIFPGDGGEISQLDKIYNVLGTPSVTEWPTLVDMAWFELLRPTDKKASTFQEKYQHRLTPAAFDLLAAMFAYDPANRPSAAEVLEHPYFVSEEPAPRPAIELKSLAGDWHEFESKALRKENERKHQEARRAARNEDQARERAKRKTNGEAVERDLKRAKGDGLQGSGSDINGTHQPAPRTEELRPEAPP